MPKVSIITPCYNAAKYIEKTIKSVQNQTLRDWEHIIVDDGSRDDSVKAIKPWIDQEGRIQLVQQPNQGVSSARNAGFLASSQNSTYLLFLDADDCLESKMLSVMTNYLETHPDVGLVYCDRLYIDDNDAPIQTPILSRYIPSRCGVSKLPVSCAETPVSVIFTQVSIIPSVAVIRRSVYEQTPGWEETFGQPYEDTDLFIHIALRSSVHYLPQALVRYRRHPTQSTSSEEKLNRQKKKLYEKWLRDKSLTQEQQATIKAAWHFNEGRLTPFFGLKEGNRYFLQGQTLKALRFYGGAAKRYIWSYKLRLPE